MADIKAKRLSKVAREFNVGISTIVEFLNKKGFEINSNPNSKVSPDCYGLLLKEYKSDINAKRESEEISLRKSKDKKQVTIEEEEKVTDTRTNEPENVVIINDMSSPITEKPEVKVVGKIDLEKKPKKKEAETKKPEAKKTVEKQA